jgi:acyl carrier protein
MSSSAVENTRQNPSQEELTAWLKARLAESVELSVDEIQLDVPFANYGVDSVHAFSIIGQLEDHFGLDLEPAVIWDKPTLGALVGAVCEGLRPQGSL